LKIVYPEIYLSLTEYKKRQEVLKEELQRLGYKAFFLLNNRYVTYFTGLDCTPTERPIGLLIPVEGDPAMVTTTLEEANVRRSLHGLNNLYVYLDYPGDPPCYQTIVSLFKDSGLENCKIGCDGLTPNYVHEGARPYLEKAMPDVELIRMDRFVIEMMEIKSEAEKRLVREAARWGCNTHRILQDLIEPGRTPYEVGVEATLEGSKVMLRFLGKKYKPYESVGTPVSRGPTWASFDAGPGTAYPHRGCPPELSKYHRKIKKGDIILTAAEADIGGYYCELERTMFVGEPSEKQKKYFKIIIEAQNAALEEFRPGKRAMDVDKAARSVFKKYGVLEYVITHSGHGRGYRPHEPPFCDIGDNTVLKPGMQFSCEPGLFVPGVGGFTPSDDVFVTESEPELNSYYPRDLESLIINYRK
jgi:Xaa-Pro aminopeptidase